MSLFRNDSCFITRAAARRRLLISAEEKRRSSSERINVLTRLHRRKTTTISVRHVRSPSKPMQVEQGQRRVRLQRLSQLTASAFFKTEF